MDTKELRKVYGEWAHERPVKNIDMGAYGHVLTYCEESNASISGQEISVYDTDVSKIEENDHTTKRTIRLPKSLMARFTEKVFIAFSVKQDGKETVLVPEETVINRDLRDIIGMSKKALSPEISPRIYTAMHIAACLKALPPLRLAMNKEGCSFGSVQPKDYEVMNLESISQAQKKAERTAMDIADELSKKLPGAEFYLGTNTPDVFQFHMVVEKHGKYDTELIFKDTRHTRASIQIIAAVRDESGALFYLDKIERQRRSSETAAKIASSAYEMIQKYAKKAYRWDATEDAIVSSPSVKSAIGKKKMDKLQLLLSKKRQDVPPLVSAAICSGSLFERGSAYKNAEYDGGKEKYLSALGSILMSASA